MLAFAWTATIGFLTLETINYVSTMVCAESLWDNGKYERVKPHHLWNCNRNIGRILLFELTRHPTTMLTQNVSIKFQTPQRCT